jgi:hypothetical protein
MRTIIPITCALCISTASRAEAPPAEALPAEAPPAEAPPAEAPPAEAPATTPATAPATTPARLPGATVLVAPPPTRSRIPEIAATIVTGGLVVATVASYREWNQAQDRRRAAQWDPTVTTEEHERNIEDINRWKGRTWLLIGGTFASAAVTMFTWMRNQDPSSFSVQPTGDGDGAAVSYSGRF